MKSNRILYPDGHRCSAQDYAAMLPNGQYHLVTVGGHEYWIHRYEGALNGIEKAVVLLSYPKDAFGSKKALRVFICSDFGLSDGEILSHYTHRWKIEVMFKQQKMYLGLKSFMVRSAIAIDRLFVILPLPVIVRDLDDDAATIIMVDSNLQRESLLPSERAFAYKMKLEAMKRQAGRPSKENCSQVGNDFGKKSSEVLAEQVGQSKNQIFRYIRLTELIPELLNMVDEKKIALNPAYELSFLKKEEQTQLLDAMDSEQATPSLSQAQRLKKFSQEGHLSIDVMRAIMGEEKKSDLDKVTFTSDTLGVTRPYVRNDIM